MPPIVLLDDADWRNNFYPFSVNRSVADLRIGIFTQQERWEKFSGNNVYIATIDYLSNLYESISETDAWYVAANVLPNTALLEALSNLHQGEAIQNETQLIAFYGQYERALKLFNHQMDAMCASHHFQHPLSILHAATDMFLMNVSIIHADIALIRSTTQPAVIDTSNRIENADAVFIAQGAIAKQVIINACDGPVYIGENALVMEGALLRGPIAVGANAVVKMGTAIYGGTSIGKHSVVGGEIKNSIIMDETNKAHHGYLGDSVIGNWCNIGAGASNSNIKNSGASVAVWNDVTKTYSRLLHKCGVLMGDYTRVAINSAINTASVMGICCNVFGTGLLPRHLPHFSWGVEKKYAFEQAIQDITHWMAFKKSGLSKHEMNVLKHIFDQSGE